MSRNALLQIKGESRFPQGKINILMEVDNSAKALAISFEMVKQNRDSNYYVSKAYYRSGSRDCSYNIPC